MHASICLGLEKRLRSMQDAFISGRARKETLNLRSDGSVSITQLSGERKERIFDVWDTRTQSVHSTMFRQFELHITHQPAKQVEGTSLHNRDSRRNLSTCGYSKSCAVLFRRNSDHTRVSIRTVVPDSICRLFSPNSGSAPSSRKCTTERIGQ